VARGGLRWTLAASRRDEDGQVRPTDWRRSDPP
jgi:hypothetical protein